MNRNKIEGITKYNKNRVWVNTLSFLGVGIVLAIPIHKITVGIGIEIFGNRDLPMHAFAKS